MHHEIIQAVNSVLISMCELLSSDPSMMFDHDCLLPHKFLTCDSFRNWMGMDGHSFTGKGQFIFQANYYYINVELLGALGVVHFTWTEVPRRI